jgi:hypothetical protein
MFQCRTINILLPAYNHIPEIHGYPLLNLLKQSVN